MRLLWLRAPVHLHLGHLELVGLESRDSASARQLGTRTGEDLHQADRSRDILANCALVVHGNQGLGFSDAFVGRWDDLVLPEAEKRLLLVVMAQVRWRPRVEGMMQKEQRLLQPSEIFR